MYGYYNLEELLGKYEAETGSIKTELRAYENIKNVIRQFDGKMFNVKLSNAMNEVIDNCSVYMERNPYSVENGRIRVYCDVRYIERNGKQYFSNVHLSNVVANLKLDGEKFNRVNANDWIEKIDIRIEELNNTLEQMYKNSKVEVMKDLATKRAKLMEDIKNFNSCLDEINGSDFQINIRY